MKLKQKLRVLGRPLMVATVDTPKGLRSAIKLGGKAGDLIEIRLDCLVSNVEMLEKLLPQLRPPILLTARHPREGGAENLSLPLRRSLLEKFLPWAAAIDVELRSTSAMSALLKEAGKKDVLKIFSFHDFQRTPGLPKIASLVEAAKNGGADVLKIATTLSKARDLSTLVTCQGSAGRLPVAAMGMGPLGRVSRLTLAACGSALSYGYLDRAQVPGQWPVEKLAQRLKEVLP